MLGSVDIHDQLSRLRKKTRKEEDVLVSEARRILRKDLFTERKILENLKQYNRSFEVLDEEDIDTALVFTPSEIKQVAVMYRLRFLDTKHFKPEIPYEAVLKIKDLDQKFGKELKNFRILATQDSFTGTAAVKQCSLFVRTNYDNFYLIHRWGERLNRSRRVFFWPMRNFETLALTVIVFTLALTMSLPTALITLDSKATYWSGYRAAAFFHLLIFDFGVTVYFTFAFAMNFSSSIWN